MREIYTRLVLQEYIKQGLDPAVLAEFAKKMGWSLEFISCGGNWDGDTGTIGTVNDYVLDNWDEIEVHILIIHDIQLEYYSSRYV